MGKEKKGRNKTEGEREGKETKGRLSLVLYISWYQERESFSPSASSTSREDRRSGCWRESARVRRIGQESAGGLRFCPHVQSFP
jgi:hypothetical protein